MKKKIIILIGILFILIGCSQDKFYLEDELYEKSEIVEITNQELIDLENDKKSFLVFVYLNGCSSCSKFNETLNSLLKDDTLTIYKIEYHELTNTNIENEIKYAPSLVIYQNGNVVNYLDANKDKDNIYYEDSKELRNWLTNYLNFK